MDNPIEAIKDRHLSNMRALNADLERRLDPEGREKQGLDNKEFYRSSGVIIITTMFAMIEEIDWIDPVKAEIDREFAEAYWVNKFTTNGMAEEFLDSLRFIEQQYTQLGDQKLTFISSLILQVENS